VGGVEEKKEGEATRLAEAKVEGEVWVLKAEEEEAKELSLLGGVSKPRRADADTDEEENLAAMGVEGPAP
jgi:hypothetical protein